MHNIQMRLTGSGGQGLILAGIILAEAAISEGKNAVQSQSYGPEARGGASKAEVIISGTSIDFPKVEVPNILLCLTQVALDKYVGEMDGEGYIIIDDSLTIDDDEINCKIIRAPILSTAAEELKKPIVANIVAIGLLSEITGAVKKDTLEKCILDRVPPGTEELNIKALEAGIKLASKSKVTGGVELSDALSLRERIKSFYSKFSKNQRAIADFILNDPIEIMFLKAYNLAKIVDVSASTVGRFAQFIGYEDYKDMQKAQAKNFRNRLSTLERFNELKKSTSDENDLKNILYRDIDNIRHTLEMNDFKLIQKIGAEIQNAKKVYIIGQRSSKVLAEYFGFYLNLMQENIKLIPVGVGDLLDELVHIGKEDVMFAFSFPRYTQKTLDAAAYGKERGAKIFALTDSKDAPISEFADEILLAESGMSTFIDSMTAPLSLINSLIIAVGREKTDEVSKKIERLENIWSQYHTYKN